MQFKYDKMKTIFQLEYFQNAFACLSKQKKKKRII